jgi:peptide-methionine (S)-S-oxide reductase
VYRTRVGYTGGDKRFPTYHSLGNHTEAMEIDFDPAQIAFVEVVDLFWKGHNPLGAVRSRQYMSAIWFHNESQRDAINTAKEAIERRLEAKVQTPIMPLDVFYLAEDYHQKYRLQHSPLMKRFNAMYPNFDDFNNSTAAARLNGFIAAHGSRELYDAEYESYGVSAKELTQIIWPRESTGRIANCSGNHCSVT